jgi:eukaryotic-like serine/threonine-protein kinase
MTTEGPPLSSIDQLSPDQQAQVATIVEQCMIGLENGESLEIDSWVTQHPALAEPLRRCLASLQTLHEAVHGTNASWPGTTSLPLPFRLGDFELEEAIGRGGMGVVYLATQISLQRRVAVKLLQGCASLSPKRLRRFEIEAQSAAILQHPNIVPVYAVGQEQGVHYYAMQYVDGYSLDEVDLSRWSRDRYSRLIDVAITLADALQHAHDLGVIHRDIKPSNLMQDASGKVWIMDFGLAHRVNNENLTLSGELIGTTNYMSPEQSLGLPVDQRTDIYSLCATLYELATGVQAFEGKGIQDILNRIENNDPVAPRAIRNDIPIHLETILLKGLSKDREDRYASAAEMGSDLQSLRQGLPIRGRRPTFLKRISRWMAKHRMLVLVGTAGLALSTMVSVVGFLQVAASRRELIQSLATSDLHLKSSQENYWRSRDLLDRWNEVLIPRLDNDTNAGEIRSAMLSDTIAYYEAYLQENAQDPQLSQDTRNAKLRLASALSSRGDFAHAITYLQEVAIDLKQKTNASLSSSQLPLVYNELGLAYLKQNDLPNAVQFLSASCDSYESVLEVTNGPTKDRFRLQHATSLTNLSQAYRASEELLNAERCLKRAEEICRSLVNENSIPIEGAGLLAQLLDHRAAILAQTDLSQAIELACESVALHRQRLPQVSTSWREKQHLGNSLHNLAAMQMTHLGPGTALPTFNEARNVRQQVLWANATLELAWFDFATTQNALGMAHSQLRQYREALAMFDEAQETLSNMRQAFQGDFKIEYHIAIIRILINRESIAINQLNDQSSSLAKRLSIEIELLRDRVRGKDEYEDDFQRLLRDCRMLGNNRQLGPGEAS